MFQFDESNFFNQYDRTYTLRPGAAPGLGQLLAFLASDADVTDIRWAAYMLDTVKHECADLWQPVEEFGKGRGRPYSEPILVTDPSGVQYTNVYYGRGYVQLTWKDNYQRLSQALKLGDELLYHPEKVLAAETSYQVMSYGMRRGSFTGVGLGRYISGPACDYRNARKIINGLDRADDIADYARNLENMLRASVAG